MDDKPCNSQSIMSSSMGDAIMDNQRTFLHCHQPKSMEELRQTLVLAQMELEATRQRAEEELRNRDNQLTHLKFLLSKANLEKEESARNLQRLIVDKFILQQKIHLLQQRRNATGISALEHEPGTGFDRKEAEEKRRRFFPQRLPSQHQSPPPPPPLSGISTVEDEPRRRLDYNSNGLSDSDESIVSSPVFDPTSTTPSTIHLPPPPAEQDPLTRLALDHPLPEKGKLLLAVMKAGPLLQTLMLAGPLPEWRHPPPPLDSYQIPPPPVAIPSPPAAAPAIIPLREHVLGKNDELIRVMRKRELCRGSDFGQNKHPRFVL